MPVYKSQRHNSCCATADFTTSRCVNNTWKLALHWDERRTCSQLTVWVRIPVTTYANAAVCVCQRVLPTSGSHRSVIGTRLLLLLLPPPPPPRPRTDIYLRLISRERSRWIPLVPAIPTSTGLYVCVSVCVDKLRPLPPPRAHTHPSSILRSHRHARTPPGECAMFTRHLRRYVNVAAAFVPFFLYWEEKIWRTSSGSDVAGLICIQHKPTNGRRLCLKTE